MLGLAVLLGCLQHVPSYFYQQRCVSTSKNLWVATVYLMSLRVVITGNPKAALLSMSRHKANDSLWINSRDQPMQMRKESETGQR